MCLFFQRDRPQISFPGQHVYCVELLKVFRSRSPSGYVLMIVESFLVKSDDAIFHDNKFTEMFIDGGSTFDVETAMKELKAQGRIVGSYCLDSEDEAYKSCPIPNGVIIMRRIMRSDLETCNN